MSKHVVMRRCRSKVVAVAFATVSFCALAGITVQDPEQTFFWQVESDVSRPLVWPWDGADSAKVVYRLAGENAVTNDVAREGDAVYGSFTMPAPTELASGRQYLYDVSLELLSGGETVSVSSARIVYLPQSVTVLEPDTPSWRKVSGVRVFPYDKCDSPSLEFVSSAGRNITREQPVSSALAAIVPAFDVVDRGLFTLSLLEGSETIRTALLRYAKPRMVLSFR